MDQELAESVQLVSFQSVSSSFLGEWVSSSFKLLHICLYCSVSYEFLTCASMFQGWSEGRLHGDHQHRPRGDPLYWDLAVLWHQYSSDGSAGPGSDGQPTETWRPVLWHVHTGDWTDTQGGVEPTTVFYGYWPGVCFVLFPCLPGGSPTQNHTDPECSAGGAGVECSTRNELSAINGRSLSVSQSAFTSGFHEVRRGQQKSRQRREFTVYFGIQLWARFDGSVGLIFEPPIDNHWCRINKNPNKYN